MELNTEVIVESQTQMMDLELEKTVGEVVTSTNRPDAEGPVRMETSTPTPTTAATKPPDNLGEALQEDGASALTQEIASEESTTPPPPPSTATETVPEEDQQGEQGDDDNDDGEKEDEEGVECGFLVDRINTIPYQKALERGEVPFCAFAPISTQDFYLLKIQDCSDSTRHMLVPASKEEVSKTPGALKIMDDDQQPGSDDILNYRVTIVGVARQIYSEEDKQLLVSVDPLLRKDKKKIATVKYLTPDKFAEYAFLGFDGNTSEFSGKPEAPNIKETRRPSTNPNDSSQQQQAIPKVSSSPPPPPPRKAKSPVRTARRGRGGRRKQQSRKSPPMPPSQRNQNNMFQQQPSIDSQLPSHSQMYSGGFQPLPMGAYHPGTASNEHMITFVNMGESGQAQQFVTQLPVSHQFQDSLGYGQDTFTLPIQLPPMMKSDPQIQVPSNEITVSTTDDGENQQTTHDIITIAFDQLVSMTNSSFDVNPCSEVERGASSSRGGRRPGRKPGRKPAVKDKDLDENTTFGQLLNMNEPVVVPGPKRRGRPPKNRMALQVIDQENATQAPTEDELEKHEKRVKLHIYE